MRGLLGLIEVFVLLVAEDVKEWIVGVHRGKRWFERG